jgi:2-polyprenyl-3-methyl-5-hydroxy-6-metoxy-1,4-benzoquinol methylase
MIAAEWARRFAAIYEEYYAAVYRSDAATRRRAREFYRALVAPFLPPRRDARLLDIGCGSGYALAALGELGFTKRMGIDVNERQIAAARAQGQPAEHVIDTIAWLRQRQAHFDFVSAIDVLEHIPVADQPDFVAAVHTALAPHGTFLCTVPNANSTVAMRWRYIDFTHQASFTESSLRFLLVLGGYSAVTILEAPFFERIDEPRSWKRLITGALRPFARALRRLELVAEMGWDEGARLPLSVNLLAAARPQDDQSQRLSKTTSHIQPGEMP